MLFTNGLEELIFQRHEIHEVDELIIVSGYLGPKPVGRLTELPFRSQVVYGMYGSDGIKASLHNSLVNVQNTEEDVNIFYSQLPVHSKCYAWRNRGNIIHALVGSANFSTNGLTTPYREILAETTRDTFAPLNDYIQMVLNNSISCLEPDQQNVLPQERETSCCTLTLLGRGGEVQNAAGLNWGQNPNNHTTRNDAYIAIRTAHIRECAKLFPPKQTNPLNTDNRGRQQRHNDAVEIIWDDGITMEALFEGTQTIDGVIYPKQISSFPVKAQLGEYIRNRLGVPLGAPVRKHHLEAYGRTDVEVCLLEEGIYKFDFSV